jgi:hypothetical protein
MQDEPPKLANWRLGCAFDVEAVFPSNLHEITIVGARKKPLMFFN